MDPERLARQLIRALRGRRSQTALSRRLGSRCNLLYSWESGRRSPTARRFFELAAVCGVDLRLAVAGFLRSAPAWLSHTSVGTRDGVVALLGELRGARGIADLARASGASRFQVTRWLSGDSEPRLPDFLRLVEATSYRVLDLVAAVVDPLAVPCVRAAWQRLEASRAAAYRSPWCHAVLRLLETEAFRGRPAVDAREIAAALGIAAEQVQDALALLETTGQLRRSGERLEVSEVGNVDLAADAEAVHSLKQWAAGVGLERLKAGGAGLYSYNLFCISRRDYARVQELHRNYFRQVRALVAESTPSEHVVMLNLQLFSLFDP